MTTLFWTVFKKHDSIQQDKAPVEDPAHFAGPFDASWGTDKWGELFKNANRVQNGKLFEWQTQTVAPGGYWLRLLVTNGNGNYGEPCTMHVTVAF